MKAIGSPRLTLAVLAVSVSSYSVIMSMTLPTLPRIQAELDTDQSTAIWVLTALSLTSAVATPIVGRLGDSFGKRRLFLVSLGLLACGSLISGLAPTIDVLIIGRAVTGLGGGAVPLALGLVKDLLPPQRVSGAISLVSSLLAVGFAAGTVVAGPIVNHLGYHALFLIPAAVCVVAMVATVLVIPESRWRSFERLSLLPAVALAAWLTALLLGLTKAPQWGWTSPAITGLFLGAATSFALWVVAERRASIPLIDLTLMANRGIWSANLVSVLIGLAMFGSFSFLPQFNQTPSVNGYGFGASMSEAGHMMLPGAAGASLMGLCAAPLIRRFGVRVTTVAGGCIASSGLWWAVVAHDDKWELYAIAAVAGLGSGLTFASLANAVVNAVDASQTGVATGMNFNLRTIGGAIGTALMTTIVTAQILPSGYPTEHGYSWGFAMLATAALLSAVAGLFIPGRNRPVRLAGQSATMGECQPYP